MSQFIRNFNSNYVAMYAVVAAKALAVGLMGAGFVVSKKSQLLTTCARTKHLASSVL